VSPGPDDAGDSADWITVARLGRPRGNRGELTAVSFSKPERYSDLKEVFLFPGGSRCEVEEAWFQGARLILKLRGVDSISAAETLTGCEVRIPRAARIPLEPGEYFESDLIGIEVIERATGAALGRVVALGDAGAAPVLELEGGMLIPFARAICVAIEPENRRILVDLPPGLKELNQA
jgi:16S rRNA processing protein RimM